MASGQTYPQREANEVLVQAPLQGEEIGQLDPNPEARRAWLRSGSSYLGGLTPQEALLAGRADRVRAALEALDSGVFVQGP